MMNSEERMVPIMSSTESEALIVCGILEENDIPCRAAGSVDLPSVYRFPAFEVLVPEQFEAEARRLIDGIRDAVAAEETS